MSAVLITLAFVLGAAALSVSVYAWRRAASPESVQVTSSEACTAITGYANNLGHLAAYWLGPDAYKPLTPAEVEDLLAKLDQALSVREKACAEK